MPTYEYQCLDCGHKVEYFQSMKEEPRTVCLRCQGRLTRLVSTGTGLIFKGSGFYITDYKKKDNGGGHAAKPLQTESPAPDSTAVKPAEPPSDKTT